MMDMNLDQVALLARIKLQEGEKKRLSGELDKILDYVKKLSEVNTEHVSPTSHVLAIENVFREDTCRPQAVSEEALKHAPEREGHFFKVPKVIEGE